MARKRMIDPSIWTDEGMAELTPRQQLLYIGLISNADDDGRMKCSPSALRLALPTIYAAIDLIEIAADLQAVCATMRQIVVYAVDGRSYLVFRNYRKWQRIDKPSASILPPLPEDSDDSPNPPRTFQESSESDHIVVPPNRREVKLTEEKETTPLPPAAESTPEPEAPPTMAAAQPVRASSRSKTLNPAQQSRFNRWYAAYPRHEKRPEAESAFRKLDPDDEMTERLIADVGKRKQGRKWLDGYIDHPSTYLNQHIWDDDIEPPRLHALPHNHPTMARARKVYD